MKKVYFKPPFSPAYLGNNLFRIKSKHNTFLDMDKKLLKKGVILNTIDLDKKNDGDLYIFSESPYPWEVLMWFKVFATFNKNILLSLESPIVNPFSHMSVMHSLFKKIYTWDDNRVDSDNKVVKKKYFKFLINQSLVGLDTKVVEFSKRKLLTFVNSKKDVPFIFLMLSPYKTNLYKERIKSLDFFNKRIPNEFDIYGVGWDKPILWDIKERVLGVKQYPTFRRPLYEDKYTTLAKYKFCLCFENSVAPGYITEKIFDCFKARTVPIYWGAPNIEKYINNQCFIDFRKFDGYEDLLTYLQNMSGAEYKKYIDAIDGFLKNRVNRKNWFSDNFVDMVLENSK
ncbi:MAG: hypothetical protein G01um10145_885 [Microgenomates group bacterium Gr01-1014_5]|nr:MAG: hypothetical protein G01um10145_885 [Microgenomates group bacterium Gr01-1014_5]